MTSSLHDRGGVPVLTTQRLVLRPHTPDDLAASLSLWSDAEVVRFIGGRTSEAEEVWNRMVRYAGFWAMLGFGYWLVEARNTGTFLGEVGFLDGRRQMDPPFADEPEMGWAFLPSAQGRGYALEATSAALDWADRELSGPRVVCIIEPSNERSIQLAGRLGFRELGTAVHRGVTVVQFERRKARMA